MQLLKSPWEDELLSRMSACKSEIRIMSPFVKLNAVETIIAAKAPKAKLQFITKVMLPDYYRGASDIEGIQTLLDAGSLVKNCQRLHAKVYVFGTSAAVVTSANLTQRGLCSNYEYGVVLDDPTDVCGVAHDFDVLWKDGDSCQRVTLAAVTKIRQILGELPPFRPSKTEKHLTEMTPHFLEDEGVFVAGIGATVLASLTPWQRMVAEAINELESDLVSLKDLYRFENRFQLSHPKNHSIREVTRRTLQELRSLGLLDFLDNRGHYRKLW
jgi:phosphatidylserine/phosphatidylglycerophosphate/cardiolipin synthase-like enzyme